MNKTELIAEVAKKCGISKKDAEKAVTTTFDTIADALSQGDKVQLVGFGGCNLPIALQPIVQLGTLEVQFFPLWAEVRNLAGRSQLVEV